VIVIEDSFHFIAEESHVRLDKYISEKCSMLSRTKAQKLIEGGFINVNRQNVKPAFKLKAGDIVDVSIPPPAPSTLTPEPIPLKIVYEDDDLMVVDKPAGLTVHPAPGHYTHTLANAVLAHVPDIETAGTNRPGIVHRLDKDTSGLIIIAKNHASHMKLADQFKRLTVAKTYQALVQGHLTPVEGVIEASIGRDPRDRQRMAVVSRGREARTEYRALKYIDNFTLLEIRPKTGRTHQIRVHLAAIGFPIVGDATYGAKSDYISRQFLHASRLRFRMPSTGEYREFESRLPPDLVEVLGKIAEKEKK
jgi:23S rRNA pseudouridine1911/1915/1917 synthase